MRKLDKVIKGLENCHEKKNCKGCPYFKFNASCQDDMNKDALKLLKEYRKSNGSPCIDCNKWECDEVCDKYKKWHEEAYKTD